MKKNWLFKKWHEDFGKFSPEHSKISKISTLMSYFWPKYKMFELIKYRRVMFDGTKYWCKIWKKTDLCFQNGTGNLANFHQSMFESLKIWTFLGPFIQSRKSMSVKFTAGAMCHDNEEWCKIWTGTDWQFKIDMTYFTIFDSSTQKSQ